ncbi:hypothetical protein [Chitinimonas sp. BJB300]|uniref:hypothetical protein n=1 Tax=Chitinimonas sp. BJB300 TaxID=1559339 RepID=UPI000C0E78D2|nr:hypothetical protein [Chitinimonas sp. BJB300]PHV09628.1 hypothetical protein CSQ89_20650 [Chitinimonas sp. BJB300]TSJ83891.1 hypothetical protein FG002_020400 [Chitinimonas sp. BJB300]
MKLTYSTKALLLLGMGGVAACALVACPTFRVISLKVVTDTQTESAAPAAAIRQDDGSLVAVRAAMTPKEAGPAPHKLPPGSKELRRLTTRLTPRPVLGTTPDGEPTCRCEPVTLTTSLVDDGKGGRRVVQSAVGADIDTATDTPLILDTLGAKPRPWSAGLSYGPITQEPGAWIARDLGRVRTRLDLIVRRGEVEPRISIGWAW